MLPPVQPRTPCAGEVIGLQVLRALRCSYQQGVSLSCPATGTKPHHRAWNAVLPTTPRSRSILLPSIPLAAFASRIQGTRLQVLLFADVLGTSMQIPSASRCSGVRMSAGGRPEAPHAYSQWWIHHRFTTRWLCARVGSLRLADGGALPEVGRRSTGC